MRSALTRPQATRSVIHVGSPETTSMPRRQSSVRSAVAAMSATSRGLTGAVKQANTCARSAVTTSLSVSAGASRIARTPGRSRFSSSTSAIAPLTGRAESVTTTSSRPEAGVLHHLERAAARVDRMALERRRLAQGSWRAPRPIQ